MLALVLVALTAVALALELRARARGRLWRTGPGRRAPRAGPCRSAAGDARPRVVRPRRRRLPAPPARGARRTGSRAGSRTSAASSSPGRRRSTRSGLGPRRASPPVAAALPVAVLAVALSVALSRPLERLSYAGNALPGLVIALSLVFFAARYASPVYQTLGLLVFAYAVRFFPQALSGVDTRSRASARASRRRRAGSVAARSRRPGWSPSPSSARASSPAQRSSSSPR